MSQRHVQLTACREGSGLQISLICLICVFILNAIGWAGDDFKRHNVPQLHGEFGIGHEGRLILLPVEVDDKKLLFLLDTGACRSAFDVSMKDTLGPSRGTQILRTPAGRTRINTYDWPDATLGGQSLKTGMLVAGVDFTELRQASNESIQGVIGMDVLKNCRLQIDFDRGIARFLKSLPKPPEELGIRITIDMTDEDAPYVVGATPEGASERFLIDTGAQGNSLRPERFDELVERRQIRLGGSFNSITVGGEVRGSQGFLRGLSVGPVTLDDLRMSRVNPSALGLRYLSRFVVTFDFPESAVYLRKGEKFTKNEPHATSGISLIWIDGEAVIKSIKPSGPAADAGVQANDVIVRVNGQKTSEFDHFSLRQLMTTEVGKKIPIRVRRDGREINFELTLDED